MTRNMLRLLGALFAITLIAAACGSDTTETTTGAGAADDAAMAEDAMADDEHDDHDDHDDHDGHDDHGDHEGHGDEHEHAAVLEVTEGTPVPAVAIDATPTDNPGEFTIEVSLTNFTITPENIDGAPVDNEGHMHLLIDGEKIERFTDLTHTVQVPEGEHLVEVELNSNDHAAYAVDGVPIRAGLTLEGHGEAAHGDDHDHDHSHENSKPAIEGDLTIDDADVTVTATWAGGEISGVENRVEVPLGSVVALTVVADVDEEVHVHGYDILADVTTSGAGLIIFTADTPGRFEVEFERSGTFITEFAVS